MDKGRPKHLSSWLTVWAPELAACVWAPALCPMHDLSQLLNFCNLVAPILWNVLPHILRPMLSLFLG